MSDSHLRVAVTGLRGQVVSALIERAPREVEIVALGRPQFDLVRRGAVLASLRQAQCDIIINAAAYTQVDQAESEPELAQKINGEGAGHVAQAASELGLPMLHLSTDYVFDGLLDRPYREDDQTHPSTVYGSSKLAGEEAIRRIHKRHVILRTAWVYSPFGVNFVKTMLRLGLERREISVVDDQLGNPSSAIDIADTLLFVARRLKTNPTDELYGTFHMTGQGDASWADVAQFIFDIKEAMGLPKNIVRRIQTRDYPTAARRPKNSRLDNSKLKSIYGIALPHWRSSLEICVTRLLSEHP